MIDPTDLPVLEGYAAWAPLYDDDGNPLIAIEEPVMRGWYGNLEGEKVLDLGCGTGRHTALLAKAGAAVVAVDGSEAMIARAKAKLGDHPVEWLQREISSPLPYEDCTFNLIVLALVAEHIEDLESLMRGARRITTSGGRMLLSMLHPDRTANGQRARFIDPSTGLRMHIATVHRTIDETLAIVRATGWTLLEDRSLKVTAEVADSLPRASPYLGQNLGWAAHLRTS